MGYLIAFLGNFENIGVLLGTNYAVTSIGFMYLFVDAALIRFLLCINRKTPAEKMEDDDVFRRSRHPRTLSLPVQKMSL